MKTTEASRIVIERRLEKIGKDFYTMVVDLKLPLELTTESIGLVLKYLDYDPVKYLKDMHTEQVGSGTVSNFQIEVISLLEQIANKI